MQKHSGAIMAALAYLHQNPSSGGSFRVDIGKSPLHERGYYSIQVRDFGSGKFEVSSQAQGEIKAWSCPASIYFTQPQKYLMLHPRHSNTNKDTLEVNGNRIDGEITAENSSDSSRYDGKISGRIVTFYVSSGGRAGEYEYNVG